ELALEAAAAGIERHLVEVDDAIEQAGRADERVERLAIGVLLGESMRHARRAERANHRGADQADVRPLPTDATDHVAHGVLHRLERRIAVLAEVVDAFEPDQRADAGEIQGVAIDPALGRWPARKWFLRAVLGGSYDLIAA